MASFICVFTKYLSKIWRKRCHILTQSFKIHFNMHALLRHNVFLCLKFYVLFYFYHHSLFNVSLLYLFISVFTRCFSKTLWKRCHISTQNFDIQFSMHVSLHHLVFLYLTFMYLSIPSLLLAEGTANTWWILLHNDRKSRHRRIKKQRLYESWRCNTSLVIPVGCGRVRQGSGGWVTGCTFKIYIFKIDSFFIKLNIKAQWKQQYNRRSFRILCFIDRAVNLVENFLRF